MTEPAFIVVLDAGDDARLTHAALNAHDPRHGVLTVHPTLATTAASALAHDFLAALGRPITGLGEVATVGLRPAWSAVTGWIVGDGIEQILVLRAHLFREAQWHRLVELYEATGSAMLVFCHSTAVPQPARQALAEIPHSVTTDHDEAVRLLARAVAGHRRFARPDVVQAVPLPAVPRSPVHRFRAGAGRQLPSDDFALVDAQYQHGLQQVCAWLARQEPYIDSVSPGWMPVSQAAFPAGLRPSEATAAFQLLREHYADKNFTSIVEGLLYVGRVNEERIRTWPDAHGLQVFLSALVADTVGVECTIARVRGAQAGFLLHGLLLDLPEDLDSRTGPGITTIATTSHMMDRLRDRLANPIAAAALAAAMFTGASPADLLEVRLEHLSPAADQITVPRAPIPANSRFDLDRGDRAPRHAVPEQARPFMIVARVARVTTGVRPQQRLLSPGIGGPEAYRLLESARACDVTVLNQNRPLQDPGPWHARAHCWFVADPLHGPRTTIDRTYEDGRWL